MKNKLISLIISLTFITPCAAAFAAEDNLDSGSDENVIFQEGFEISDHTFWTTGTCTKNSSTSNPYSGAKCLSVTNRTYDWEGIETDLKNKDKNIDRIDYGAVYEAEAWVRLDNTEAGNAEFCMQICVADKFYTTPDEFLNVDAVTVSNGKWAQIKGLFSTVGISSTARVSLRIGAYGDSNNKNDFSVDDVIVRKSDQDVQGWSEREDFENNMNNNKRSLKDAYSDDFMLGAARSSDWGELSDAEDELIKKHFDIITLTNAMKPDALSTHEGRYMWGRADYIVNKSLKNNVKVHGHVLAWHQQTPQWIWDKLNTASEDERLACLRTYITDVMTHYNEKCYSWDVVNEAIKDGLTSTAPISDILRDSPWRTALGDDWVYKAFLIAKKIDPDAVLYYNDYGVEDPIKTEAVYTLVKDVNDKYKRNNKTNNNLIDGIGVQGHFNMGTNINMVRNMLEKFKELGVKVSISEMDIAYYGAELGSDGTLKKEDEIKQAQKYAQLMQLFKEYGQSSESKLIERVSFWGTDDNTSWLKEYRPLLFNKDFSEKEAFEAVLDPEGYLGAHPITETGVEQAVAIKGTPTNAAAWNNVPSFNINKRKQPLQDGETAASATVKSMWDGEYIYLLIDVTDSSYSSKDKVTVFLDERNNKNSYYDYDDVFFEIGRVNNSETNNSETRDVAIGGTWEPYWERSAECTETDHGYLVYLKIPTTSEVKVDESGNAVLNSDGFKEITQAEHHTRPGVVGFEVKIDDDNNNDYKVDYEIFFNQIDDGLYGKLSTAGELALTNNGVAGVVKEVVKQQGAHNSVATGFRAETKNHSFQDITFNNVIWDIKATNGVMKTTGERPLKTNVTLKPGAFTYISLIVDGLYDYAEARMYVID